ncbi:MAG: hypothetical protein IJ223_02110 [Clostridia bacterium]|nr:hypothetical protein [Clostridia bacterium]
MNLQTLSIILIIIILPITLILSAYTKTQIDTLALQTRMRTQLKNATYDGVVAFQLNTVQNEYSTVSDSMRRDVSAAIQTFMTNLAGNMGMSGATENALKPYIPAIVFTMYDGYYIYAPSKSTIVDNNGQTKTSYEHVLKPYIYYTVRYVNKDKTIDVVVNYSLDNYIVVTGTIKGKYVTRAGYLEVITNNKSNNRIEYWEDNESNLEKNLPVTTVVFKDNVNNRSSVNNIGKFETEIAKVNITNLYNKYKDVDVTDRLSNGILINDEGIFKKASQLTLNRLAENREISLNNGKILLNQSIIRRSAGLMSDRNYHKTNYTAVGGAFFENWYPDEEEYNVGFYIDPSTNVYYVPADSAKQYYDEAEEFTNWVKENLGSLTPNDAVKADGTKYKEFENKNHKIFDISESNNPEDESSLFNDHREEVIKASIRDNLGQAIASYSENSEKLGPTSSFQLPVLNDIEWHQILTNVCFITFMQGVQVGTKMFNEYCIVTSTRNKEYVSPDSIYYINEGGDGYYHKLGCKHLTTDKPIVGYRNSEFDRKSYEIKIAKTKTEKNKVTGKDEVKTTYDDQTKYYFMHSYNGKDGQEHVYEACYYCMVTKADNSFEDWRQSEVKTKAYYTAMAREKFNFYKTNSYFRTEMTE